MMPPTVARSPTLDTATAEPVMFQVEASLSTTVKRASRLRMSSVMMAPMPKPMRRDTW